MRSKISQSDLDIALVVDDNNRPVRWLLERDMRGDKVPVGEPAHELVTVELAVRSVDVEVSHGEWLGDSAHVIALGKEAPGRHVIFSVARDPSASLRACGSSSAADSSSSFVSLFLFR